MKRERMSCFNKLDIDIKSPDIQKLQIAVNYFNWF